MTLGLVNQTTRVRGTAVSTDAFALPFVPAATSGLCLLFHIDGNLDNITGITGCGATWTQVLRETRGADTVVEIWVADKCDGVNSTVNLTLNATSRFGYDLTEWGPLPAGKKLTVPAHAQANNNVTPVTPGPVFAMAGDVVIGLAHNDNNINQVSANPTTPDFTTLTSMNVNGNADCRGAYKIIPPVNPVGTPQVASGAVPFSLALPPERTVGDELRIGVTHPVGTTLTTPTGWTAVGDAFTDPCHATMFARTCDGTETTVTIAGPAGNAGAVSMCYAPATAGASNTGTAIGTGITFNQPTVSETAGDRIVHVTAAQKGTTGADTIVMGTDVVKRGETTDTATRRIAIGSFVAASTGTSPTEVASGSSFNPNNWAGVTQALTDAGGMSAQPLAWSQSGSHTWAAGVAVLRAADDPRVVNAEAYVYENVGFAPARAPGATLSVLENVGHIAYPELVVDFVWTATDLAVAFDASESMVTCPAITAPGAVMYVYENVTP